jgi:hypothetical protein
MKEKILEIAEKLRLELITDDQAQDLLLGLFDVSQQRELLLAYENYCDKMSKIYENPRSKILLIDAFLSQ